MAEPRRLFGVATLTALASGTLCAVAGTRAAVSIDADGESAAMVAAGAAQGDALTMPLVTSLALVGLGLLARTVAVTHTYPAEALTADWTVANLDVLSWARLSELTKGV